MTRGQFEARNRALCHRLRRAGLIHVVPLAQTPRVIPDPLADYREQYGGLTRGALFKHHPGLYRRLRANGQLEHVLRRYRAIADPLAYSPRHNDGRTRWELWKRDCGPYQRLQRAGCWKGSHGKDRNEPRKQGAAGQSFEACGAWPDVGPNG